MRDRLVQSKLRLFAHFLILGCAVLLSLMEQGSAAIKIRPLSKGWYRLPYIDATKVSIHTSSTLFNNGHNGYDMFGNPRKAWNDPTPYKLVAVADGIVRMAVDSFNLCGNFPDMTHCNNKIWIEHSNGEFSAYYHIAFGSAQIDSGDCVVVGQYIADEGDVGITSSPDGVLNRPKTGCDGSQDWSDSTSPYCAVHLHFAISNVLFDMDPDSIVNPQICGIAGHALAPGMVIQPADNQPCNGAACSNNLVVSGNFNDTLTVVEADISVASSGTVVIDNSVIGFQAGNYVRLNPGFKAKSGCYFRARIGLCDSPPTGCFIK